MFINKLYYIIFLLGISLAPALAQVAIGFRAGAGITGFSGRYNRTSFDIIGRKFVADIDRRYIISEQSTGFQGSILGYQGGLVFRIALGDQMDFVPEVNYYATGTNLQYTVQAQLPNLDDPSNRPAPVDTLRATDRVRFSYLNFPLLFRVNFEAGFNVQLGPYFAYRIAQSQTTTKEDLQSNVTTDIAYTAQSFKVQRERSFGTSHVSLYPRAEFGFVAGVGYDLPGDFSLDLRYQRSFLNIFNDRISENNRRESSHKLHSLTVGVSYYFLNQFN